MNADIEKIFKWAEEAFQKRNYDYARDMFLQVIALDPNNPDARKLLWATNTKKHAELGAPSKIKIGFLQAKITTQFTILRSKPDKAAEISQQYLNDDPSNIRIRSFLAENLHSLGHAGGAIAELQIAKEVAPDNIGVMKLLASYLKERKQISEAEEVLKHAQSLAPNDRDIDKMLCDLAALSSLKQGIEVAQSYKSTHQAEELEKGRHLIKTDKDIDAEIESLKTSLGQTPSDVKTLKKIGDLYFDRKKDYVSSQEWYAKAAAANPSDSALKDLVDDSMLRRMDIEIEKVKAAGDPSLQDQLKRKRQFQIQSFQRRSADRPTDMSLHFELGKIFFEERRIDEEAAEVQNSVKEPKRKVDSHIYLGLCFWKKKMHDIALTQFRKSLEAGVLSTEKNMSIRYNMALCYADAGETAKALEEGKKIMEIDINYKDISKRVSQWTEQANV